MYAANSNRFHDAYQDIARRLKLPGHDAAAVDLRELVLTWLHEEDSQWLMILDNEYDHGLFLHPSDAELSSNEASTAGKPLIDYLPTRLSTNKSLLITTRKGHLGEDLANGGKCVEVPVFDVQEARLLV